MFWSFLIVAVCGGVSLEIVKLAFRHRENIERIRNGADYIADKSRYSEPINVEYNEKLQ